MRCNNRFSSFGSFELLPGPFWAKKRLFLGHTMCSFGRAPPDLAPLPRGANSEFLAENLVLARPPPRL